VVDAVVDPVAAVDAEVAAAAAPPTHNLFWPAIVIQSHQQHDIRLF
jgi:hypothetical protein